mmetsp:Transcript_16363/g.54782  ORF Transcript_16363/g.54782 Transcript_16363/m.54782 type:complete len:152 (+) Transcript_16363:2664-3119(+)
MRNRSLEVPDQVRHELVLFPPVLVQLVSEISAELHCKTNVPFRIFVQQGLLHGKVFFSERHSFQDGIFIALQPTVLHPLISISHVLPPPMSRSCPPFSATNHGGVSYLATHSPPLHNLTSSLQVHSSMASEPSLVVPVGLNGCWALCSGLA